MTKIEKEKLVKILKPSKAAYTSTPFENRNSLSQKNDDKFVLILDESIELEDEFELTVKINIEK